MTDHQLKQQQVINKIEEQIKSNSLNFSIVSPVADLENDPRICLTSVHLPKENLKQQIQQFLIEPLRKLTPDFYYYTPDSLHITIKNIRVINNPPHFTKEDVEKVKKVFTEIVPQHKQFNVYFYKLLLFPNSLALMATTDPELDDVILTLDNELNSAGVPDDKVYTNSKYFFSNMTLARFSTTPSEEFKQKVQELSNTLNLKPYTIDSVTLLTCNAVFKNRQIKGTWKLQSPSTPYP